MIQEVSVVRDMSSTHQLVHLATAPVLYEHVITDNLYKLFDGFSLPQSATISILHKADLLKHIRHLYLEYPKRDLSPYHKANINNTRIDIPRRESSIFIPAIITVFAPELASLIDIEMIFVKTEGAQLHLSMPSVESMAVGSYFGSHDIQWTQAFGCTGDLLARVGEAQRAMTRMFLQGNVKHFCQGGDYGPLSLHPVELNKYQLADLPTLNRSLTIHTSLTGFNTKNLEGHFASASAPAGTATRWCFDGMPKQSSRPPWLWHEPKPLIMVEDILKSYGLALVGRHEGRDAAPETYKLLPITVDAYIPLTDEQAEKICTAQKIEIPNRMTEEEKQEHRLEKAANKIGEVITKDLLETGVEDKVIVPGDSLRVHYIRESPACPACHWTAKGV